MIETLPEAKACEVLFDGEADEYAQIIQWHPISHQDCIEILRAAARMKSIGFDNSTIIMRMTRKL